MATIKIIVAYDKNRGIGYNNTIPWFIPGELAWVANTTKTTSNANTRNALVMGRKTWESIPTERRPLPGRLNVVISRTLTPGIRSSELRVFTQLHEAINQLQLDELIESIFIFGGATLYEQSINEGLVDEILVTEVPGDYPSDTYFPTLPRHFTRIDKQQTPYGDTVVTRSRYTSHYNASS